MTFLNVVLFIDFVFLLVNNIIFKFVIYLFKMSLYTMYKVAFVATFDFKMPYYILWWQELRHFLKKQRA